MAYTFDPDKHPRDPVGQFSAVLNALSKGEHAVVKGEGRGPKVHNRGDRFIIKDHTGKRVGSTKNPDAAAKHALKMHGVAGVGESGVKGVGALKGKKDEGAGPTPPKPDVGTGGKKVDSTMSTVRSALEKGGHYKSTESSTRIRGWHSISSGHQITEGPNGTIQVSHVVGQITSGDKAKAIREKRLAAYHKTLTDAGHDATLHENHVTVQGSAKHIQQVQKRHDDAKSSAEYSRRLEESHRAAASKAYTAGNHQQAQYFEKQRRKEMESRLKSEDRQRRLADALPNRGLPTEEDKGTVEPPKPGGGPEPKPTPTPKPERATGPTPEIVRDRITRLEAAIEQQKREAPAGSGLSKYGNPDTVASLNHNRQLLVKLEGGPKREGGGGAAGGGGASAGKTYANADELHKDFKTKPVKDKMVPGYDHQVKNSERENKAVHEVRTSDGKLVGYVTNRRRMTTVARGNSRVGQRVGVNEFSVHGPDGKQLTTMDARNGIDRAKQDLAKHTEEANKNIKVTGGHLETTHHSRSSYGTVRTREHSTLESARKAHGVAPDINFAHTNPQTHSVGGGSGTGGGIPSGMEGRGDITADELKGLKPGETRRAASGHSLNKTARGYEVDRGLSNDPQGHVVHPTPEAAIQHVNDYIASGGTRNPSGHEQSIAPGPKFPGAHHSNVGSDGQHYVYNRHGQLHSVHSDHSAAQRAVTQNALADTGGPAIGAPRARPESHPAGGDSLAHQNADEIHGILGERIHEHAREESSYGDAGSEYGSTPEERSAAIGVDTGAFGEDLSHLDEVSHVDYGRNGGVDVHMQDGSVVHHSLDGNHSIEHPTQPGRTYERPGAPTRSAAQPRAQAATKSKTQPTGHLSPEEQDRVLRQHLQSYRKQGFSEQRHQEAARSIERGPMTLGPRRDRYKPTPQEQRKIANHRLGAAHANGSGIAMRSAVRQHGSDTLKKKLQKAGVNLDLNYRDHAA